MLRARRLPRPSFGGRPMRVLLQVDRIDSGVASGVVERDVAYYEAIQPLDGGPPGSGRRLDIAREAKIAFLGQIAPGSAPHQLAYAMDRYARLLEASKELSTRLFH